MMIFKRRPFAAIILALVVIVTIPLSGGRALRLAREEILRVYVEGADGKGLSIANDLLARADATLALCAISTRAKVDEALISKAEGAAKGIRETESVKESARLNGEMENAVAGLVAALSNLSLSDADQSAVRGLVNEIESRGRVILGDHIYNDRAEAFNRNLKGFPANVIAPLAGIAPLEPFK